MTKRPHYRAWILCGALGACLSASGGASAQPTTDPNQRATDLYKKGNEFYDKSKWADAENMYRAAFDLKKSFEIAGNLGDVEMIQGKPRDAAEHLAYAIRQFPPTGKPAQRVALEKRLQDATNLIGTVNIKVSVLGAEVFLDGVSLGKSPLEHELYVDRGDHVVEAKKEGYEPASEKLTATPGSKHDLSLTLKQKPKPAPVKKPDVVEDTGSGKSVALLVGGGIVTTVALATGIGMTVAANGKSSDGDAQSAPIPMGACAAPIATQYQVPCKALLETRKDQGAFTNTATVAYIIAGIAGVATVTYALWPTPKSSGVASVRPVPVVTSTEGGLWLKGTF
jgi:hypothetical protein